MIYLIKYSVILVNNIVALVNIYNYDVYSWMIYALNKKQIDLDRSNKDLSFKLINNPTVSIVNKLFKLNLILSTKWLAISIFFYSQMIDFGHNDHLILNH